MSHTPGPWESDRHIVGWELGRNPGIAVWGPWIDRTRSPVCLVSPDTTEFDPMYGHGGSLNPEADAALIAAAPELLEALRAALEYVDPEGPVDTKPAERVRALAEAAIAKAEGR